MEAFKLRVWELAMKVGNFCGCHQRADRSFFFRGYQFPVCARCFGLWCGYIIGLFAYKFYRPIYILCIGLMLIMLIDWLVQYLEVLMSNNIRRFTTGMLCGYGFINLLIGVIKILFLK
jgi:uncharacterized membrane protein